MKKQTVALLFGGVSSEYEVSCLSVSSVWKNIDREKYDPVLLGITKTGEWYLYSGDIEKVRAHEWDKDFEHLEKAYICPDRTVHGAMVKTENGWEELYIDVVFPVLHGRNGEDGTMQGLLEIAGIPYVGCKVLASAACMDKDVCHALLSAAGIAQVKWLTYFKGSADFEAAAKAVEQELGWPVFVKPANAGSSVGISKVKSADMLKKAMELAFEHDVKIIIEEAVLDPIEVECAVLGNDELLVGGPGEIVPADEFYSYDAKYFNDASETLLKARIPEEMAEEIRETAKRAYKVLGCAGLTRVDFLVNGKTGKIVLNEPNTLPGFTDISMYSKLIMNTGMTYAELIDKLLELASED
ncbi:MAG: D-alanine--D-alanine ligase [Oscillospiraceae bacterium]|nr:D-alanine--D-alanine ligase [Oscillospiraceae bacterium]